MGYLVGILICVAISVDPYLLLVSFTWYEWYKLSGKVMIITG